MKIIVTLFVIVACATTSSRAAHELTEEQKLKLVEYGAECAKELEVPEEDMKKIKAKDISNASEKQQCFLNCVMEKIGVLKDGVLQEDFILEKLIKETGFDEEKAAKVLGICKGIEGENECEIAYNLTKCFTEHSAINIDQV